MRNTRKTKSQLIRSHALITSSLGTPRKLCATNTLARGGGQSRSFLGASEQTERRGEFSEGRRRQNPWKALVPAQYSCKFVLDGGEAHTVAAVPFLPLEEHKRAIDTGCLRLKPLKTNRVPAPTRFRPVPAVGVHSEFVSCNAQIPNGARPML